jgi:hypothetical protein
LTGATEAYGKAEYEEELEDGELEREFKVEVRDATPDSVLDVVVDSVTVGTITVDANGRGRLKLEGADLDRVAFPDIVDGSTVQVGDDLSGILQKEQEDEDDEEDDEDELEFVALLTGDDPLTGKAEFEIEQEDGEAEREFELELEDGTPGSVFDVSVGGVIVGQVTLDAFGRAKLELTSDPDDSDELPLPEDFPEIGEGTEILVGDALSGTFAQEIDD